MIAIENVNTFVTGVFPDTVADNSTGAATQDGFEFIAEYINNSVVGPQQAIMDYAGLTPDGVTEAAGASQMIEAIQKGNAVGPGWVGRRDINATPAVNGDRSLILSDQGVLISAYPELDAAVWITGNTAAQVAAIAAGTPYYRSSDAAGLIGDAAGPYLQLPANPSPMGLKQYSEAAGYFTATAANWTTASALIIPYQTVNGDWRLRLNITGTLSVTSANFSLTISGVVFKTVAASKHHAVTLSGTANGTAYVGKALNGTGNIQLTQAAVQANWDISGDIPLDSKPTFADDFEPQYAITY